MKVYIGKLRWNSQIHYNYMNKKYNYEWEESTTRYERFLERFENALQWIYDHSINLYFDKMQPKTKVRIDPWDTWSMDVTLAHIIVPMLKQLQETKHGSPYVDDADVPEEYRSISAPKKENDWDIDDLHHARWNWVIYEMAWAFEQASKGDWESQYYKFEECKPDPNANTFFEKIGTKLVWEDPEGRKAHQERMNNGFRLFGKYYQALWD